MINLKTFAFNIMHSLHQKLTSIQYILEVVRDFSLDNMLTFYKMTSSKESVVSKHYKPFCQQGD